MFKQTPVDEGVQNLPIYDKTFRVANSFNFSKIKAYSIPLLEETNYDATSCGGSISNNNSPDSSEHSNFWTISSECSIIMTSDKIILPQIIIVGDSRASADVSFEIYASSDDSSLGSNIASVTHTPAEPISTSIVAEANYHIKRLTLKVISGGPLKVSQLAIFAVEASVITGNH